MFIGRMAYGKLSHRLSANKVLLITNIVALLTFAAMVLIDNMAHFHNTNEHRSLVYFHKHTYNDNEII